MHAALALLTPGEAEAAAEAAAAAAAASVADGGVATSPGGLMVVGMLVVMLTLTALLLLMHASSALARAVDRVGERRAARRGAGQRAAAGDTDAAPAGATPRDVPELSEGVLVAILSAAAWEAVGAPVRVLGYRSAREQADAHGWTQLGKTEHFDSHRVR